MAFITTEVAGGHVLGTESGLERVASSPQLLELLSRYCVTDGKPEACFVGIPSIGTGCNSEVWEVDGMAVKLSTETTGRSAWLRGPTAPENLLNQFRFMDALAVYFGNNAEVTAPDQYLALRSPHGAYLLVQQYMGGWQSLQSWIDGRPTLMDDPAPIVAGVKERIKSNTRNPLIRLGLDDLGLPRQRPLYTKNILVPSDTECADETQICIIDQPSRRLCGHVAVAGLRVAARAHAALPRPLLSAINS